MSAHPAEGYSFDDLFDVEEYLYFMESSASGPPHVASPRMLIVARKPA